MINNNNTKFSRYLRLGQNLADITHLVTYVISLEEHQVKQHWCLKLLQRGWSQSHIKPEKSIFRPKLQKPTDRPCRIQNTEEENRKQKRRIKKKNTEHRRRIQNTGKPPQTARPRWPGWGISSCGSSLAKEGRGARLLTRLKPIMIFERGPFHSFKRRHGIV